jgi:hypothetical protein
MEKTLAVITITISDEPLGSYGSSGSGHVEGNNYYVKILPNADKELDPALWADKNAAGTVIAHEIGHVIGRIVGDPREDRINRILANFGDYSKIIPAEKQAWNLAEIMYPELSKNVEKVALGAYLKGQS